MFAFKYCQKNNSRENYILKNFKRVNTLQVSKHVWVLHVRYKTNKTQVVLKMLAPDSTNKSAENLLKHEYTILKQLNHKNIIKPIDWIDNIGMIVEYIPSFELFMYIREEWLQNNMEKIQMLLNLIDTLQYLHTKGLYHLDIKLENILVCFNKTPILIDFGCCLSDNDIINIKAMKGTYAYFPPERLRQQSSELFDKDSESKEYYSKEHFSKFDSWSLGCIVLSMIDSDIFMEWINSKKTMNTYDKIREHIHHKYKKSYLTDLLDNLWVWDINERVNILEL